MRIVVAPAGSRGDFQPLLALSVGLRAAGHDVVLLSSPNYAAEVAAFDIPFAPIGFDVEQYIRDTRMDSPLRATYQLFKVGREKIVALIDDAIPLVRGADALIGGGAQIAGPTVAEAVGIPYLYAAYTPQALWSSHHPPFTIPFTGLPRPLNRLSWRLSMGLVRAAFAGPLNRRRRTLGLSPVTDLYDHLFPRRASILAADPELAPPAPDSPLAHPPTGAWHLADPRPLGADVERFLGAGPPPVYLGFGSMPDERPDETTRIFVAAARAAGVRLILSRGWAGFGSQSGSVRGADASDNADTGDDANAPSVQGDDLLVIGPTSHGQLFPRVAAVVHHGGAGTTAAATRAGRPQIVVPHVFDQFQWARWAHLAGVAPPPFSRKQLSAARLSAALKAVAGDERYRLRAAELGATVRGRDSIAAGISAIETLLGALI